MEPNRQVHLTHQSVAELQHSSHQARPPDLVQPPVEEADLAVHLDMLPSESHALQNPVSLESCHFSRTPLPLAPPTTSSDSKTGQAARLGDAQGNVENRAENAHDPYTSDLLSTPGLDPAPLVPDIALQAHLVRPPELSRNILYPRPCRVQPVGQDYPPHPPRPLDYRERHPEQLVPDAVEQVHQPPAL